MASRRKKKKKPLYQKTVHKKVPLKPSGPVEQVSHVGVRYHKGYVYDSLRYTVLTCNQLSKEDRELVEGTLKPIVTGAEAMTLPSTPGWRTTQIDQAGRAFIVSYHGTEVALFYKRQLTELRLYPGDSFPEGVLQDPVDAWQRLDLIGQSAKRANIVLFSSMKRLEETNKLLETRVQTLDELNDSLQKEHDGMQRKINELETQLKIKQKRAARRAALKEKQKKKLKRRK